MQISFQFEETAPNVWSVILNDEIIASRENKDGIAAFQWLMGCCDVQVPIYEFCQQSELDTLRLLEKPPK